MSQLCIKSLNLHDRRGARPVVFILLREMIPANHYLREFFGTLSSKSPPLEGWRGAPGWVKGDANPLSLPLSKGPHRRTSLGVPPHGMRGSPEGPFPRSEDHSIQHDAQRPERKPL